MTYWHMQFHSDDASFDKEKEILEKKSIIGIPESQEYTEEILLFKKEIKIGDIVLVRKGKKAIALVQVLSEAFFEEKIELESNYFENKRKVIVLKFLENINDFPYPSKTLINEISKTTKTYSYIDKLFDGVKNSSNLNKKKLIVDSDLIGHANWTKSLIKLDEERIVSASDDNTIRIWDIETQSTISVLKGHDEGISSLIKLDEKRIASASDDNTIRIWDIETKSTISVLKGHDEGISSLIKLDEERIVSASDDNTIRIWDIETQSTISVLKGHDEGISSLIKLDEKRIASASDDNTIRIWDIETQSTISVLKANEDNILSLVQLDEKRIVSSSRDGSIDRKSVV